MHFYIFMSSMLIFIYRLNQVASYDVCSQTKRFVCFPLRGLWMSVSSMVFELSSCVKPTEYQGPTCLHGFSTTRMFNQGTYSNGLAFAASAAHVVAIAAFTRATTSSVAYASTTVVVGPSQCSCAKGCRLYIKSPQVLVSILVKWDSSLFLSQFSLVQGRYVLNIVWQFVISITYIVVKGRGCQEIRKSVDWYLP